MRLSLGATVVFGLFSLLHYAYSANIAFFLVVGSKSHMRVQTPIAKALAKRGHNVTMYTHHHPDFNHFAESTASNKYEGINIVYNKEFNAVYHSLNFPLFTDNGITPNNQFLNFHYKLCILSCENFLDSKEIRDMVHNLKGFYDVALIDATYSDCFLPLLNHVAKSIIYVMPTDIYSPYAWTLNIPGPYSFIPNIQVEAYAGNMNFMERVYNTLSHLNLLYFRLIRLNPQLEKMLKAKFPELPNDILEAEKNVSIVFTYRHPALDGSTPRLPFVRDIGGAHLEKAKPVPKNIEDFISGSGDAGFVYVSLGTVPANDVPKHAINALTEAFSRIPQRVIWAWKGDTSRFKLSENVLILKWAPQQDILGHPKIKVIITHAGQYTLMECLDNGVPMITLPMFWDQPANAKKIEQRGFGIDLPWDGLTSDHVIRAFDTIINGTSHKETIKKYQKIFQDNQHSPVEEGVFWTEYTIRHGGSLHLRSQGDHLNTVQYLLLDVFAFLGAIVLVPLFIAYKTIRIILKMFIKKQKSPVQNGKKQK